MWDHLEGILKVLLEKAASTSGSQVSRETLKRNFLAPQMVIFLVYTIADCSGTDK